MAVIDKYLSFLNEAKVPPKGTLERSIHDNSLQKAIADNSLEKYINDLSLEKSLEKLGAKSKKLSGKGKVGLALAGTAAGAAATYAIIKKLKKRKEALQKAKVKLLQAKKKMRK